MRVMKIRKTVAVLMGAAALGVGAAAAAAAPDGGPGTTVAAQARAAGVPAPSCVKVESGRTGDSSWVHVSNGCGETVRLKILWNYAYDTACFSVPDGRWLMSSRDEAFFPWQTPSLQGVELC